jgi:polysaccharide biosynthesis transport protein
MASTMPAPRAARPADEELSLAELLLVLHRRRWLLLGCLLLGGLAGIGALAVLPPVYEARALLIIEPDAGGRAGATVPTASQTPDSASVDSQVQIMASRSLAREAVGALRLDRDSELTGAGEAADGPLARLLRGPAAATDPRPADPVDGFLDRLSVTREGKSHVIAVAWRSADPRKAAAVANKLAELYMAGQLARKEAASRRLAGRSDAQLGELKGRLEAAEAELALPRVGRRDPRPDAGRGSGRDRRP